MIFLLYQTFFIHSLVRIVFRYNKNGGDESTKYTVGYTVVVGPSADGYDGWKLNGNDKDLGLDPNTVFMPGDTFKMPANNINFKGANKKNTPITFTVTYAPGTQGTFTTDSTIGLTYGAVTPTPPATSGNPGYTFAGWDPVPTTTVKGDATYVAQWTKKPDVTTFTVTYAPGTQGTFTTVSNIGLTLDAVTPTPPATQGNPGYTFAGWDPTWEDTVTGDVIYTALWSQNPITPPGGGGGGTGGGGGGTTATITDPEPPLAEIPENETPMVEAPEVVLEDQPIPLADVPQTSDNTNIWLLLALMMGSGAGIVLLGRRKETVEK